MSEHLFGIPNRVSRRILLSEHGELVSLCDFRVRILSALTLLPVSLVYTDLCAKYLTAFVEWDLAHLNLEDCVVSDFKEAERAVWSIFTTLRACENALPPEDDIRCAERAEGLF